MVQQCIFDVETTSGLQDTCIFFDRGAKEGPYAMSKYFLHWKMRQIETIETQVTKSISGYILDKQTEKDTPGVRFYIRF